MEHAKDILSKVTRDSTKVVVMFTDGSPTERSDSSEDVANGAISAAKSLKDSGATVYTVGCLDGADGTPVTNINSVSDVNKYMHLVSSNYKNAESMSSPGTSTYPAGGKSYYLSAGNSTELNNVFENISSQIGGSDTELTSSSVLKDAVTPYFEIPGGTNAQITLKTAACTGADSSGKLIFGTETAAPGDVQATVSDNSVSVTGFDYSANWCGPHRMRAAMRLSRSEADVDSRFSRRALSLAATACRRTLARMTASMRRARQVRSRSRSLHRRVWMCL